MIIKKEFRFEASHQLPGHDGHCARLHGHSYILIVGIESKRLIPCDVDTSGEKVPAAETNADANYPTTRPDAGMVIDFAKLKEIVKPIIDEKCDHHFLNDTIPVPRTTAEIMAMWFFGRIQRGIRDRNLDCSAVFIELFETTTSSAVCHWIDWELGGRLGWEE